MRRIIGDIAAGARSAPPPIRPCLADVSKWPDTGPTANNMCYRLVGPRACRTHAPGSRNAAERQGRAGRHARPTVPSQITRHASCRLPASSRKNIRRGIRVSRQRPSSDGRRRRRRRQEPNGARRSAHFIRRLDEPRQLPGRGNTSSRRSSHAPGP